MVGLPKPYFQDEWTTIYNCDCRDILPLLPANSADLVLTDPPYLNLKGGLTHFGRGVGKVINSSHTVGDAWQASLDWMQDAWQVARYGMIVFCSYAGVAETRIALSQADIVGLITWYKRNSPLAICNVPRYTTEFAWLFKKQAGLKWAALNNTLLDIPNLQGGCMATERILDLAGRTMHPTQKPLVLIKELLKVGPSSVCDPFAGLGTTLVAAKSLGRKSIGMEIEEKYCEIAVRRLAQMPMIFEPVEMVPEPEQRQLDLQEVS